MTENHSKLSKVWGSLDSPQLFPLSDLHFPVRGDGFGGKKHVDIIILLKTAQTEEQTVQHFCFKGSTLIIVLDIIAGYRC